MPRNSSGTYSLPAGNPVVSNTLIQSTWANPTMSDLGTGITDSLDRSGRGAMLAALKNIDGTAVAPSITFSSEGTLGAYRVSAGVLGIAAGGALVLSISAAGLTFTNPLVLPLGSAAAPSLTFTANTNTGIYSPTTNQVAITTNGAQRVLVDATGNVTLATGALVFPAAAAGVIEASNAAGTLALQTGGANTRLSIDAAGLVTHTGASVFTGVVGIGGANALGKLQVFGGAVVVDNGQNFAGKTSGGTAANLLGLDGSNNLLVGPSASIASQLFATGGTTRMTLDGSGNLGFRVTPSAWGTLTAIEGSSGALGFNGTTACYWMQNLYFNGSNWTYKTTAAGSVLTQFGGSYQFNITPSGTAGTSATLAVAMTLDGTGNLSLATGTLVLGAASAYIGHNSTTGNITLGANATIADATARIELYDVSHATLAKQIAYRGDAHVWTKATASTPYMSITSAGVIQDAAGNELGYKGLPQNSLGGAYTIVQGDNGKKILQGAAATVNTATGLSADFVTSIMNLSGSAITITQAASTTIRFAGTATTGSRTLAAWGICTLAHIGSNVFLASGAGLS